MAWMPWWPWCMYFECYQTVMYFECYQTTSPSPGYCHLPQPLTCAFPLCPPPAAPLIPVCAPPVPL